jgi:hypothetical protein
MVRLPAASALFPLGLTLVLASATPAVLAQYSPNCERNGRRDFCAYTPGPDPAGAALDAGRLVFADHRVYGLQRDESSCRQRGPVRTCKAWILSPGSDRPIPATYRGTAYEGGYRHEYISAKLRLSYSFLD